MSEILKGKLPEEKKAYKVVFSKPYNFEGKEYTELDLSGLENLKTYQLAEVGKKFSVEYYISPRPEADVMYCCMIAAEVCGLPFEYFNDLPAKDANKIKIIVQDFFL